MNYLAPSTYTYAFQYISYVYRLPSHSHSFRENGKGGGIEENRSFKLHQKLVLQNKKWKKNHSILIFFIQKSFRAIKKTKW